MEEYNMNIRSLFLASISLIGYAATAMERPASPVTEQSPAIETTDLFARFEQVRLAIIGKAKAQGLQIPDSSFAHYFVAIFTKAIQQASTAQLSNSERENLSKCIIRCSSLESLDKQINAIKQDKNLITVISKIIGEKKAQAAVLAQAFKAVDQKYATQEQIEQIIAQAFGQQNNSALSTTTANTRAQSKRDKFYWEDLSDDDELNDQASLELAWKLQQQEIAESKPKPQHKPDSKPLMTDEDEALARALALSEQEPALRVNTEDEELQLALAISKKEANQQEGKSKAGKEEIPLPKRDQKNNATNPVISPSPKAESKKVDKEIECAVCGESRDSKLFVLALNEDERDQVLAYIASDKGIESRLPGIKKYTESCMHTICKECKKTMALGYQPEGEENVNVLIRVYCPTCNIRTRTAKRS